MKTNTTLKTVCAIMIVMIAGTMARSADQNATHNVSVLGTDIKRRYK